MLHCVVLCRDYILRPKVVLKQKELTAAEYKCSTPLECHLPVDATSEYQISADKGGGTARIATGLKEILP